MYTVSRAVAPRLTQSTVNLRLSHPDGPSWSARTSWTSPSRGTSRSGAALAAAD